MHNSFYRIYIFIYFLYIFFIEFYHYKIILHITFCFLYWLAFWIVDLSLSGIMPLNLKLGISFETIDICACGLGSGVEPVRIHFFSVTLWRAHCKKMFFLDFVLVYRCYFNYKYSYLFSISFNRNINFLVMFWVACVPAEGKLFII